MDKTINELDEDLKSYSALTVNNGQIRITAGIKRNIKSFIQCCRDTIRVSRNPVSWVFPVVDAVYLIKRYMTHEAFVKMSPIIINTTKPTDLKDKNRMKWLETNIWTFLQAILERNGIILLYIIRDNNTPTLDPSADMYQDYINEAPLIGDVFASDSSVVHTYIVKFITEYATTEAKILVHTNVRNGRLDFTSLKEHY